MHIHGIWRASVIACTLATGVDTFLDVQSPLRPILALCFLLLCPGMALVGLLRIEDMAVRVTLSLALSVARRSRCTRTRGLPPSSSLFWPVSRWASWP